MHALLLTVVAFGGGANAHISDRGPQPAPVVKVQTASHTKTVSHTLRKRGGGGCTSCNDACNGCNACGDGGRSGLFGKGNRVPAGCGRGAPQTCYAPRYGCYHSNNRHMARYPAFHGHFYRRPYNYRNTFDYPWHAEMHEPTSMFSYNVTGQVIETDGPPAPPAPAEARAPRTKAKTARISDQAPAIGTGISSKSNRRTQARPIGY